MPNKMFVWKVELEVQNQYKITERETGKLLRTSKDVENVEFHVAAPTGFKAIERAGKLALDKANIVLDDWSDPVEDFLTIPVKVMDVVELSVESTLDG